MAICTESWLTTYQNLYPKNYIQEVIVRYYNHDRVKKEVMEHSKYWHGYWVAEVDGHTVGCIGGGVDDDNKGHVYVFYVAPECKRSGLGTRLLEVFTNYQVATYAITEQWISSVTEGNSIGVAFYEKAGFHLHHATSHPENPTFPRNLYYQRIVKAPINQ